MANQTTLTFAGDADSLRRAAQQSTQMDMQAKKADFAMKMAEAQQKRNDAAIQAVLPPGVPVKE